MFIIEIILLFVLISSCSTDGLRWEANQECYKFKITYENIIFDKTKCDADR